MPGTYDVDPFTCGYCGNDVKFQVVAEDYSQVHSLQFEQPTPFGIMEDSAERGWIHRLLLCPSCKEVTFERVFTADGEPEESEVLFPPPLVVPDGLPEKVAKEYCAALKERRRNPNGYAALLGRTLDAVCSDRGIPNKTSKGKILFLGVRLAELVNQEKLSSVKGVVGLRNVAAHADAGDLLPEDVPYLEILVKYVLDHLYLISTVNQKALDAEKARRKKPPRQ